MQAKVDSRSFYSHPFCYALFIVLLNFGTAAAQSVDPTFLAARYAPLLFHDVGHVPMADYLTPVDFDGDWIANNNWDNLPHFPLKAVVYYDVRETGTHFYITYMFFHPRDYARVCFPWICHENDAEGAIIAVNKSTGREDAVQTLAHNNIKTELYPILKTVPGFVADPQGRAKRVALYIEPGGHGVKYLPGDQSRFDSAFAKFHAEALSVRGFNAEAEKHFLFVYGNRADFYDGAESGVYSYDLLPLSELWRRRHDVGKGRLFSKTFNHNGARFAVGGIPGSFAGEKWGAGRANPPWGWHDSGYPGIRRGDWFLDPAFALAQKLPAVSTIYRFNPFLP